MPLIQLLLKILNVKYLLDIFLTQSSFLSVVPIAVRPKLNSCELFKIKKSGFTTGQYSFANKISLLLNEPLFPSMFILQVTIVVKM